MKPTTVYAVDEIDRLTEENVRLCEELARLNYAISEIYLHLKIGPDPVTALRIAEQALPSKETT